MKREVIDYITDIKNECEYLLRRAKEVTYDEFIKNEDLKKFCADVLETYEKYNINGHIIWKK